MYKKFLISKRIKELEDEEEKKLTQAANTTDQEEFDKLIDELVDIRYEVIMLYQDYC